MLAACDVPDIGQGREVLHAQPVNFALDHRTGLGDPRGQIGNRLACDMHLLSVDGDVIQNLLYCIKRCDLELAGIASSAYVSGISSAWSRTNRNWARPASTWAAGRPASRSSSRST